MFAPVKSMLFDAGNLWRVAHDRRSIDGSCHYKWGKSQRKGPLSNSVSLSMTDVLVNICIQMNYSKTRWNVPKDPFLLASLSVEAISHPSSHYCREQDPHANKDKQQQRSDPNMYISSPSWQRALSPLCFTCTGPAGRSRTPVLETVCSSLPNCSDLLTALWKCLLGGGRREEEERRWESHLPRWSIQNVIHTRCFVLLLFFKFYPGAPQQVPASQSSCSSFVNSTYFPLCKLTHALSPLQRESQEPTTCVNTHSPQGLLQHFPKTHKLCKQIWNSTCK